MSKRWLKIDAENKKLGRLATEVATLLMGKDLPTYTQNQPASTHVVILNCDQVKISEKRLDEPVYHHTGYIGHLKSTNRRLINKTEVVKKAVLGMLPKNKTHRSLAAHLHCIATQDHPYKQYINE